VYDCVDEHNVLVLIEADVTFSLLELGQNLGDECFGGARLVSATLFGASAEIFEPSIGSSLDFWLVLLWAKDDFCPFVSRSCFAQDGCLGWAHERAGWAPLLTATWHWLRWKARRKARDGYESMSG
jgi:hypothetical protein